MTNAKQDVSTRLALEQAQKSAEALFETKSIAEIKKVRHAIACHLHGRCRRLESRLTPEGETADY
jgi:hypothetical protein